MRGQDSDSVAPASATVRGTCGGTEDGSTANERHVRTDGGEPEPGRRAGDGSPGPHGRRTLGDRIRARSAELPVAAGAFIGAIALVIPYVVITAVTYVAADRGSPIDVAASVFFTVVEFGSGQRVVGGFVSVTDISSLRNVRPSEYPSVEAELGAALDLLQTSPEAALFLLYMVFPWTVYLGGRYLARHYTPGESALDHARASATVVVGTLPTILVLGLVFSPPDLLGTLLRVGVVVPGLIAGVGALSVYAFRDVADATSKMVGWLGVALGVLVTLVLLPPLPISLDLGQRFVLSAAGYLATASLEVGFGGRGLLLTFGVALAAILAGFVRASLSADEIRTRTDGVHLGASVVLGTVGAVALLGAVVPLFTIVISTPFGTSAVFATVVPTVATYVGYVIVAGVLFSLGFGALGGYLAARYYEGRSRPAGPPS